MIYRATGNIRAIQIMLGHIKIENTVRYLGWTWKMLCSWPNVPKFEPCSGRPTVVADRYQVSSQVSEPTESGMESGLPAPPSENVLDAGAHTTYRPEPVEHETGNPSGSVSLPRDLRRHEKISLLSPG